MGHGCSVAWGRVYGHRLWDNGVAGAGAHGQGNTGLTGSQAHRLRGHQGREGGREVRRKGGKEEGREGEGGREKEEGRSPEVTRGHQRSPEVTRGHQRSPEVTRGHQRSPEVTRGHHGT
jgi:hypothetical protein